MTDPVEEFLAAIEKRTEVLSVDKEIRTIALRESHGELRELYYRDVSRLLALVRVYRGANEFYIGYKGAMGTEARTAEEKAKGIVK